MGALAIGWAQNIHGVLSDISVQKSLLTLRKYHWLPLVLESGISWREHTWQVCRLRDSCLREDLSVLWSLVLSDGLTFDHSFGRNSVSHLRCLKKSPLLWWKLALRLYEIYILLSFIWNILILEIPVIDPLSLMESRSLDLLLNWLVSRDACTFLLGRGIVLSLCWGLFKIELSWPYYWDLLPWV